ncbi:peptidoglycan-binding protein [Streptomyces hirsutus]|uniref:Peptidoglycan-binding protein n=1 Tax=Streptomyces hirsutus TaxID=35620 RepID=A0ABZ1GNQ6_9ACTN|nr:peptidoglycan-binding protein [Streptomyces hirsutus]WSD06323.1 peptidoglycan-binding protein [Streptomyces hirsutus]
MDDSTGTPCPECGAPRNRDNTPSCACTLRASDALREARTAQAAEAEGFTPPRIRPYVELDDGTTAAPGTPNSGGTPGGGRTPEPEAGRGTGRIEQTGRAGQTGQAGRAGRPEQKAEESPAPSGTDQQDAPAAHGGLAARNEQTPQGGEQVGETTPGAPQPADATMQLRALTPDALAAPETPGPPVASGTPGAPGDPDATSVLPSATPVTAPQPSPLAAPLAPPTTEPSATDLNLFDSTRPLGVVSAAAGPHAGPGPAPDAGEPSPPGGRRRTTLLVAAGAVVAVIGAAGWASGLFAHETPSRDGALPENVRASVLNAPSDAPSAAPATSVSGSPEASAPASASAPPSGSASPSASPSASESEAEAEAEAGASATPSDAAEPSATPTATAPADVPEEAEELDEGAVTGPTLRRGDRGPEVVDLQQRLSKVYLYNKPANGRFNGRTEEAVRNYQWSRGIRGDELGVYGPETRARLEAETGNR